MLLRVLKSRVFLQRQIWIVNITRSATQAARASKQDKTRCCRILFYKIQVRPRFCRSYPLWHPWLLQKLFKKYQQWKHKHWCFCYLQAKTWIKMPKQTIFLETPVFMFLLLKIFDGDFWRNNWQSIFDVVERLRFSQKLEFLTTGYSYQ